MHLKTFHTDTVTGFRQAWEGHTNNGFHPNAAVIFSSVDIDLQEIVSFLQTANVQVFGCSSCGEFLYDTQNQVISEGGLVCLMMALIPESFEIKLFIFDYPVCLTA